MKFVWLFCAKMCIFDFSNFSLMATLDTRNLKLSPKDLAWLATVILGFASNYYAIKTTIITNRLEQDKENAVITLKIDNLSNGIAKNALDIKELQLRVQEPIRFVPNTEKPL